MFCAMFEQNENRVPNPASQALLLSEAFVSPTLAGVHEAVMPNRHNLCPPCQAPPTAPLYANTARFSLHLLLFLEVLNLFLAKGFRRPRALGNGHDDGCPSAPPPFDKPEYPVISKARGHQVHRQRALTAMGDLLAQLALVRSEDAYAFSAA